MRCAHTRLRLLRAIVALITCSLCTGCVESEFQLASDSRLPRWFSLPANLKRSEVSVRITHFTFGAPRIQLIGADKKVVASVTGVDRRGRETEGRGVSRYPLYSFMKVGDIEEVIEHRSRGAIIYIAEKVAVSESDRSDVSRAELQHQLATRGRPNAADFGELTDLALYVKDYAAASLVASERLRVVRMRGCECNDDTHKANIVLGLAAVRQGKVEDAKQYLLAAGRVGSSPVLSTFGPNMQLAKELLEHGERETVMAYFDACAIFWTSKYNQLAQWKQQVARGETPAFGANVLY